jgi:hypothetical protein
VARDTLAAWTLGDSGKVKRIRRNGSVTVTPCDFRDNPHGKAIPAQATLTDSATAHHIRNTSPASTASSVGSPPSPAGSDGPAKAPQAYASRSPTDWSADTSTILLCSPDPSLRAGSYPHRSPYRFDSLAS